MEKRKESLRAAKLCRFCLSQDQSLDSLYDRNRTLNNAINLHVKILSCVSIEVFPSDKMPGYICSRCKTLMNLFYDFKQIVGRADESIFHYLQNGTPMETIEWPTALTKILPCPDDIKVVKTLEGGTTIQVSSQEVSDSDEDDANVYSIKIGDGLDDTNTARIKVVTGKERDGAASAQSGFVSLSKLTKHVRSHAGDRPYPCKFCDKSFTKSHHYTRHLRLKHREAPREEPYRCDQCDDAFTSQDDLIYHSAIHATQNLTCPLCQEKFPNVDDVTAHIKSHVNGVEFMCDFCELVFTTKEKLDDHLVSAHEDEVQHEESEELDDPEEFSTEEMEDDNGINLKDEGDHMVIEINKGDYVINKTIETEGRSAIDSEESEAGSASTEAAAESLPALNKNDPVKTLDEKSESKSVDLKPLMKKTERTEQRPTPVFRRNEEIKRKSEHPAQEAVIEKKEKKCETNSGGANDKSLRLLEKELQDLKRTNSKPEVQKASPKNLEMLRNKRLQMQTSTPKSYSSRASEEKKLALANKTLTQEKKPERRQITKENKEPKDVKESKTNNGNNKEEKETPKSVIKNGANNDKNTSDDGVRRSTRPSKIKDYAKMVRDKSQPSSDLDESSDEDEEYRESDRSIESRPKIRRVNPIKAKPADTPPAAIAPRKRGRPRKESKNSKETPAKIKKDDIDTTEEDKMEDTSVLEKSGIKEDKRNTDTDEIETNQTTPKTSPEQKSFSSDLLVSPSGQTLKKVPIKALPPGVKPLPLPVNARPVASGELCEMQIGKKVVKVQKIVMTKAEVEAMAKKGLVEMKDGTMVLKQGIKLPTLESVSAKQSNLGEGDTGKESLITKKEKAVPTRCDLGDDS